MPPTIWTLAGVNFIVLLVLAGFELIAHKSETFLEEKIIETMEVDNVIGKRFDFYYVLE